MPRDVQDQTVERDVNAAIKQVLHELEEAARQAPAVALHPYALEGRRKVVIRAFWTVVKRCRSAFAPAEAPGDAA
jgi:hypothetical protein